MADSINPRDIDLAKVKSVGSSLTHIKVPFELTMKEFLDFASDDLKGKSLRHTINALGNIKRSIDCLFDSLLFATNLLEISKSERWNFPEKMKTLGEIGIITPYILSKINSARNLLEHEFKKPIREEVEVAFDIALLLHYSAVGFTRTYLTDIDFECEDEHWKFHIEINREDRNIEIFYDKQNISVSWDESPEDYKKWLYLLYQLQYLRK